jgi:hypothetical protein
LLRLGAVVFLRPLGVVLHFNLPHDLHEQVPVRFARACERLFRAPDRADRRVELLTFLGEKQLLTQQHVGQRRLPLQQSCDLLQRQPEKLQHDDLLEARRVGRPIEAIPGAGAAARLQQAEAVVVMQRADGDAREPSELPHPVDHAR